jgi:hypothetical protein
MAEDRSVRVLTGIGSDGIQLFDNIYTDKLSLPIDTITRADTTSEDDVYFTFYDYKLYVSIDDYLMVWDSQVGGEWTKYEFPVDIKYVGALDNLLSLGSNTELYGILNEVYMSNFEFILDNRAYRENFVSWDMDDNVLLNGDFEDGFNSWNVDENMSIQNGSAYCDNGIITRTITVPTDNLYYIYINYNVSNDMYIAIDSTENVVEGSGVFSEQVTGSFELSMGRKPDINNDSDNYLMSFGWNFLSVISGNSVSVSSLIVYLEDIIGSGNVINMAYYIDGVETYYNTSGDYLLNYGDAYWMQSNYRNIDPGVTFNHTIPENVTLNFITGNNYVLGNFYQQYYASELIDKLQFVSRINYYDRFGNWQTFIKGTHEPYGYNDFVIGTTYKYSGLLIVAEKSFTVNIAPVKGFINDVSIVATFNYELYKDILDTSETGIIPIDWNYKTKVFGDSFEYYQDFDKIWLRGIQTEESDIRVDYTCNNDLGYYSDYILMTLYGDSLVNTGVNSLLGAGGRDIQAEISGEGYIRLDGISIKRTLREE